MKFLLESGVDVNTQDDFSSPHRVARQKRYDPNAGTPRSTACYDIPYRMMPQSPRSGISTSAIASNMATTFLASQHFIMQC